MFEEFYQKYETEEQEVIALIRKCIGAGYHKSDTVKEVLFQSVA